MMEYISLPRTFFQKNTMSCVLVVMLVISIFFHYRTGQKYTRVCQEIMVLEGYFDVSSKETLVPSGIDMDAVLIKASEHGRLMDEDSPRGRAYRWWVERKKGLVDLCSRRLHNG